MSACIVCGQPLEAHSLELQFGVAVAVMRQANGDVKWCSELEADRYYTWGEISILRTIVRSLRYRAGRLRTSGHAIEAQTLMGYSYKAEKDLDRKRLFAEQYYPWKEIR